MNQIKSGIILSYASLALNNIVAIVYTPVLLRYLGQSEYGLYSLITSIIAYLTILDLGLGNTIVRYSALYKSEGKITKLYDLFGLFIKIYLGISCFVAIIGVGLYTQLDDYLIKSMNTSEIERAKTMYLFLIGNLIFTFPLSVFSSIVTAYQRFVFAKALNIIRIVLQPLIMTPLLIWGYKAVALVVVITALNLGTLIANMLYSFIKLKIRVSWNKTDPGIIREIFIFSFYIFLGVAVDKMNWSTGQIILGLTAGPSTVAVYAVAIQILLCFFGFASSISGIFLPKITEMINKHNSSELFSQLFIKIGRLQYILLLLVLMGFYFFGKSFILFWAGKDYSNAYGLSLIVMIPLMLTAIQHTGVLILQAMNRQKFRSIVYFLIAIFNIFLSWALSSQFGEYGCAISFAICMLIGNILIMNLYFERKIRLDITLFWKEIFKSVYLIISMVAFGYTLIHVINPNSIIKLCGDIIIFSTIFTILSYYLYMNTYERHLLFNILKKLGL